MYSNYSVFTVHDRISGRRSIVLEWRATSQSYSNYYFDFDDPEARSMVKAFAERTCPGPVLADYLEEKCGGVLKATTISASLLKVLRGQM